MLPVALQSPHQIALRTGLEEFLPTDVINIIDGYYPAFSGAAEVLTLGKDGKPADSEGNRAIVDMMKSALTAPDCDREIIRLIFKNADDNGYTNYLNGVMRQVRASGKELMLDKVDFSGINLTELAFDGANMTEANFTAAGLNETCFCGADLTGSTGLPQASGNIFINRNTILTNTGLYSEAYQRTPVTDHQPYYIALLNPPDKFTHMKIVFNGTTFLIPYDVSEL